MEIVCVRTGDMYEPKYVERLRDAVAPHPLTCISDQPERAEGVKYVPNPPGVFSWWCKLWLYSLDSPKPLLALDLDIAVLKPVEPFFGFNHPMAIRDFLPGGKRSPLLNGSVIFLPESYPEVWETYRKHQREIETTYPTEQHYLWHQQIPWSYYPDAWTSSYRRGTVTEETKIVVFHGRPKPHEVGWSWQRQCPPE